MFCESVCVRGGMDQTFGGEIFCRVIIILQKTTVCIGLIWKHETPESGLERSKKEKKHRQFVGKKLLLENV